MSCYNPCYVERRVNKLTHETHVKWLGKLDLSEEAELLYADYGGYKNLHSTRFDDGAVRWDMIQVPCGKCIGCRIDYSRTWADRMTYHVIGKEDKSWFITLTYDDDFIETLPFNSLYGITSLHYEHMDDFVKNVRNKFRGCDLDYYYSGEYGDSFFRPHYHMILYNAPLDDLSFFKCNDNGDPIYISEILLKAWNYRGFVTVSPFCWLGAAYTASYVEKKRDGRMMCEYTSIGIEPEKCRMSRRPGIGYDYYLEHCDDLWKNGGLDVGRDVNSKGHLGMCRYFRKLAVDKGIGFDSFIDYQKNILNRVNVVNPLNVANSSFDLENVSKMLKFEEREILSQRNLKKI